MRLFVLAVYTWDTYRFMQQLSKMRHVLALKEKPNYSLHFSVDDAFIDIPATSFSFIGSAQAPLRLLSSQVSYSIVVPIMCQYTMEAIGSCRVSLKCTMAGSSGIATPASSVRPLLGHLAVGSKFTFTLTVDTIKGLSSIDFSSIHAQTRLSSLVGSSIASEDTFVSPTVDLDKSSVTHLSLRRQVSIFVTPEIVSYLTNDYATIEIFAKVRPEYLARLERFDRTREVSPPTSAPGTPLRPGDTRPAMRRCETDFIAPEHHDILAKVSISELSAEGSYVPTEVVDDVFQLHQGVQRRMNIFLSHSSGKSLPWLKITHVSTSDVRLSEKGGVVGVGKPCVEMKMINEEVEYTQDGTSRLEAHGGWDTAAHNCLHLNRKTQGDGRLLVRLTWLVEVETLDEPAVFQLDLPIRILGRDVRRSSFLTFFSSSTTYDSFTATFGVDLSPPLARSTADLWRLDTAKKHVPGEETLGNWKPRSLSLLEDFARLRRTQRGLADVQATTVVLDMLGDEEDHEKELTDEDKKALIEKCVGLWQREIETRVKVSGVSPLLMQN